jgi:hypothetical protein
MQSTVELADDPTMDSARRFARPMEVVYDDVLDVDAKRHLLQRWKTNAQSLAETADFSARAGKPPAVVLQQVSLALHKLETICGSIN